MINNRTWIHVAYKLFEETTRLIKVIDTISITSERERDFVLLLFCSSRDEVIIFSQRKALRIYENHRRQF